ncbi:hypothetical protein EV284_3787 [Streptomyces sp. BK022]|uniref:hypothetical protein n=1 Tax=Streptomyces sp. BK022 TaxID=2512123 RepID=UPI001028B747|nr:hypothetical protein [Streptomyces sp. BK022]RZU36299.1 hypothetical protein EV284_3787 [Streptomyces sp. BK022]
MNRRLRNLPHVFLAACALLGTGPAAIADTERPEGSNRSLAVVVRSSIIMQAANHPGYTEDVWVSNLGRRDITDVSVTIDASALGNVSDDVDVPCDPDGDLVGECRGIGPVRSGVPVKIGDVRTGGLKASAVGTYQMVRIAATTGDGPPVTNRFTVAVDETGPEFDRGAPKRVRPAPGETMPLPGGFTNYSRSTLEAVRVSLTLSQGLSLTERFRNCVWQPDVETGTTRVECKLKGPFAPYASYDFDFGALRIGAHAMYEDIGYRVREMPAGAPPGEIQRENDEQGDGPNELTAVPRTGATTSLRPDDVAYDLSSTVDVRNTADFVVGGATVRGRPGDVVPVELTVRNLGPGERDERPEEQTGNAGALWFSVPSGVTVVHAPPHCVAYEKSRPASGLKGFMGLGKPKGRGYSCGHQAGPQFQVGHVERQRFELRIDKPAKSSTGYVTTMYRVRDPRLRNNTARVEVKVP